MNMNIYKISTLMLGAAMLAVSCKDIDQQVPESGSLTKEQSQETNIAVYLYWYVHHDGQAPYSLSQQQPC